MNIPDNVNNVLQYNVIEERIIKKIFDEIDYEKKTTFFGNLSIAEWYGLASLKKSVNDIVKNWFSNVEYFTEFVMCVNYKSWEHYERNNVGLAKYYALLYHQLTDKIYNEWSEEEQLYFFRITD